MELNLKEILKATKAKILKNETDENTKFNFSTDTRTIKKGEIYLPLKGEFFDGEKFIKKALEAGAAGFFCTEEKNLLGNEKSNLILKVNNTLITYLELARFCKRKIAPKTIAITGSSGKTTTKEMAFCVAKEKFTTHKSELNYNNEIGLCKTMLSMPEKTEVLILEMGMRGLGEIELLSKYSEPDIGIISNVGSAHIGRLGSKENIAKAKCEIINHIKNNGTLIANDDEFIKAQQCNNTEIQNIYFSLASAKILKRSIGHSIFKYKGFEYELNIEGDYNIQNALAVIEMGKKLGLSEDIIAKGLKNYSPIEKRWEIENIKGFKVINDSYNANPESMQAAIKTAMDIYIPSLTLVLGDMGELGNEEIKYHKEIGDFLAQNYIEGISIITVGKLANQISKVLEKKGIYSKNFNDNINTAQYILKNIKPESTIILKASRSMKFEEIINEMKKN